MTKTPTMTYEPFDVVVVPFPFTDSAQTKRRPALVLSEDKDFKIGHSVLAMITSRKNHPWPLDCVITDKRESGLKSPSVVRMKLFTLDHRFILKKVGHLSETDQEQVKAGLNKLFGYLAD